MAERTIHFDNAREAQDVTGTRGEYLPPLEQAFGVAAVSRDLWLKLDGDAAAVAAAGAFVDGLLRARNAGMSLNPHAVAYARQAYAEGRGAEVDRLAGLRVDVAPGRAPVFPRTFGQAEFLETIRGSDLTFGLGPAGTGKTFLAAAYGAGLLLRGEVDRLIVSRPAVEAGERLGFLPGDMNEKVDPYMAPVWEALTDILGAEQLRRRREKGEIEVAPIAFLRGRTLSHAFVIVDEAQNTTRLQMKMVLTRIGEGSRMAVTGDPTQIDLVNASDSGLAHAVSLLEGVKGVGVNRFAAEDIVRHPMVERIVRAYDADAAKRGRAI